MHFVLSTIGTLGDTLPFVWVGAELQRRGHTATVLANAAFEAVVRNCGLEFEPIGSAEEYNSLAESPELYHPLRGVEAIAKQWILPSIGQTLRHFRRNPASPDTVLIGSVAAVGMRIAQEVYELPLHTLVLSPFFLPSVYSAPISPGISIPAWMPRFVKSAFQWITDGALDRLLRPGIEAARAAEGLQPLDSTVRRWWFSPSSVVALFPEWFAPVQPDWPARVAITNFLPPLTNLSQIPPGLHDFLAMPGRLAVITMGSVGIQQPELVQSMARAALDGGFKCLVLVPGPSAPETAATRDSHFLQVPFAPLRMVLPGAAVIVHHAGIGTASAAIWAGVPQIVVPCGHDQFDNAARLVRIGVARRVSRRTCANASVFAAELRAVSTDERLRASAVRGQELFSGSPDADGICSVLERNPARVLSRTSGSGGLS